MSAPEWLVAHLTQLGRWNADGIRRRIELRTHTCGEPVFVGLDSERGGLAVAVQPDALDELGEAVAVLTGRGTYEVHGLDILRPELNRRDSFHLAGSPAGSERAPYVVGEHRCGQPLPVADDPPPRVRPSVMPLSTEPPF